MANDTFESPATASESRNSAAPSPIDRRDAYSIEEAQARSTLSRAMIFELMRLGKLQRVKVGRRTLIPAESLRALLTGAAA
ncbi:MerR family transcriptional regulator [Sandarakinorhabdus rubra]|uniref:helix-turn-helix domain-containing protein n=1 Tax=Sandarakinorhabdus rubra TaxID=2672568 RepID=UPI0013D976DC|nr:helix-turn-helix domain-containing protein [Sandarakinorhabdus rubra]